MKAVILVIRLYQWMLSPLMPATCRFSPTCSEYMCQSLNRFGLTRGGYLGFRRLLRCHPWHEGGLDPIPDE